MFSFGVTNQVMVLFLEEIGIEAADIGTFMTLTLVGDVSISYFLSWNADKIGRRAVLVAATVMMFGAGMVFATQSGFWVLLVAAIVGVISPSGDETGPFKTIEEASIAHLTPHNHRPEVFAFHGMFSTVGNAVGSLAGGLIVDFLNLTLEWDLISCYRAVFVAYALVAVAKFFLMVNLSERCEVRNGSEQSRLIENGSDESSEPSESHDAGSVDAGSTASVASRLLLVFFLDSLGYGFMPASWIVYYYKSMFGITATLLGALFFFTSLSNTVTTIPSAFLAKRFGPVRAILMTQAPSSVIFMLIAGCTNFTVAAGLLFIYYSTTAMDVVPRQILITSVVKKEALTRVMGTVNTVKTFARCVGPTFTGWFAANRMLNWCFVISGVFTLMCDGVLGRF
ncbi:MFS general substrate transporter [Yamadazyma tenuis ATCC 10573]|uniref:MFS general substrate transporter n=1 Tax=Candida tenuis (strain ATCC 10573 / BCRC 21748 / CBS 615 / JCM 9827 / NBRC 10315 / NRRL Y-1498 / VKM Y-70) TaxID=590646 RepID=G3B2U2_CANTC|nr:MFS general substrate transporter [Yamadazyma tenuis ATCC 10573]EGV64762.1 MFS general substrate transporter [Yamadazyma tenuis ATCC 10573]